MTVDIELEEGSLIARVTAAGLLLTTYGVIADYKGFKEGLLELTHDARAFSEMVSGAFVEKAGVSKDQIYRVERRLKTPGKLYRVTKRLERLENSVDDLSPSAVKRELAGTRAELEVVIERLSPEDREFVEKGIYSIREKLPPREQWPETDLEQMRVARMPEQEQELFESDEDAPSDRKRRVVYKKRKTVAPTARRVRKKRNTNQLPLLPTPDSPT